MSYVKHGQDGLAAFDKGNFPEAISKLKEALKGNPKQPNWLVTLCEAYLKVKPEQAEAAYEAAERAYAAASLRGNRRLMIHAMHFRATSLYRLKRFADADRCCRWVIDLACGKPATAKEETTDVDEEGRYKMPEFNATEKLPFKQDYSKEGTRIIFFRGRVVKSLKELAEEEPDHPSLKPVVMKMPDVSFDAHEKEQAEKKDDSDVEERKAGSSSSKPKTMEERLSDLHAEISEHSHGSSNTWQKYYDETLPKMMDGALLEVLEKANTDFWQATVPRHDFFQRGKTITLTIYVKGGDKHLEGASLPLEIQLTPSRITIYNLPGWGEVGRAMSIEPYDLIQPFQTTWKVSAVKLEINLVSETADRWKVLAKEKIDVVEVDEAAKGKKKDEGAWIPTPAKVHTLTSHPDPKLLDLSSYTTEESTNLPDDSSAIHPGISTEPQGSESTGPTSPNTSPSSTKPLSYPSSSSPATIKPNPKPRPSDEQPSAKAPAYPTSSKTGPKNWDKLDADEEDDEMDKNNPDHFFKMLYKNSTPEQQRAMMKSFIESNGTALSTDWSDVSRRTVPTEPPEGVEAKKWEE